MIDEWITDADFPYNGVLVEEDEADEDLCLEFDYDYDPEADND